MAGKFESDPEALRAAAAHMAEREADVGTHGETLASNTAARVGHGAIGEVVDSAVKRGLRIVAHDLTTAVRKFYGDVGTVLRKMADETERTDRRASSTFDDLARARHGEVGSGRHLAAGERPPGLAKVAGTLEKRQPGLPRGEDPTPEAIREGTVRMEEHPEYGRLKAEMEEAGYPLEPGDPPPRVERVQFVDRAGNVLREEQRIVVQPGMRFLDLEHEAGHVLQFTERFGGNPPFTERFEERPGLPLRRARDQRGVLGDKQNAIAEFHNRLQEYNRLAERGVSPEVLGEHEREMRLIHDQYRAAVKRWRENPTKLTDWASAHFPDIGSLMRRYAELGGNFGQGPS